MYNRILVPTDGSHTATLGLQEAIKLAKERSSKIRIIHVLDELLTVSSEIYGSLYDRVIEQLRKSGSAVLATAQTLAREAGLTVETQLVETVGGPAGEYVVRAAKEWPADLIVCGTHGRRGLRRIVLGSDAEYIVSHSTVPVMLLRDAEESSHVA
jgi:nucleotide-binding universal stress UspA family protein